MKITADKIIENYVQRRKQIKELEDQISELKGLQTKCEEWLLNKLTEDNAESIKTEFGTVYTTMFESVTVSDKDAFLNYVRDNHWECMEVRAAKSEVLHLMGDRENGSRPNMPPPGVQYTAIKKVGVRKGEKS